MASMSLLQYTAWSDLGWWWWWCPLHTWLCQVLEESWVFQLGVQWEPSQRYCCNQQPVSWDYWFITGFMCCYSWGIPSVGSYTDGSDRYSPNDLLQYKWESCFTIQRSSWGYDRIDSDTFYNTSSLIKQLVSTVPVTTISVATNWWNAPTVATHKTSAKPIVLLTGCWLQQYLWLGSHCTPNWKTQDSSNTWQSVCRGHHHHHHPRSLQAVYWSNTCWPYTQIDLSHMICCWPFLIVLVVALHRGMRLCYNWKYPRRWFFLYEIVLAIAQLDVQSDCTTLSGYDIVPYECL